MTLRPVNEYFRDNADQPLYHYTGITSLLGMSTTSSLWASHVYYLNDRKEILHACDRLKEAIKPQLNAAPLSTEEHDFATQFYDWVGHFYKTQYNVFVFSLSEVKSLLSQWRSYTPHGRGISIEFSPAFTNLLIERNDLSIAKCIYNVAEQDHVLREMFAHVFDAFKRSRSIIDVSQAHPTQRYFPWLEQWRDSVLRTLAIIKHQAFAEEREWRLISKYYPSYVVPEIKYREGASLLVPYIQIDLGEQRPYFDSVTLGPSEYSELSHSALSMFLSNHQLSNVTYPCDIPYRKW